MSPDITHHDEQYICDECGYTSPIANERCPDCGAAMSALHDEKPKAKVMTGESEADLADDEAPLAEDGSTSLEALAEKEQKESDSDYASDAYGDG